MDIEIVKMCDDKLNEKDVWLHELVKSTVLYIGRIGTHYQYSKKSSTNMVLNLFIFMQKKIVKWTRTETNTRNKKL